MTTEIFSIRSRIDDFKKPFQSKMEKAVMKKLIFELQYYKCAFEYRPTIDDFHHMRLQCCVCNKDANYFMVINEKYPRLYMCFRCKHSFEDKIKKRKYQNAKEVL